MTGKKRLWADNTKYNNRATVSAGTLTDRVYYKRLKTNAEIGSSRELQNKIQDSCTLS